MSELNYKEMRKAVESEQALMKFMLALPPDQFQVRTTKLTFEFLKKKFKNLLMQQAEIKVYLSNTLIM
jgi:hypothetical protein